MGFFPASAFAPGFDISGNSITLASVPQMPTELETYSYPPFSLEMAQNHSPSNEFEFDVGTNNPLTQELPAGAYGSNIFEGTMPVFSGVSDQSSQDGSNLDELMMDLMPDMGTVGDNDRQWRAFLAESGIPTAHMK